MEKAEKILLIAAKTTKFINEELVKAELSESDSQFVIEIIKAANESNRHVGFSVSTNEYQVS